MSLTSFLKIKEVKEKFKQTFKKPSIKLEGELLVLPQTTNYSLVGTAFDYLMRFILEHHNHNAITFPWIAEQVLIYLDDYLMIAETKEELDVINDFVESAPSVIKFAKNELEKFKKTGDVSERLLHTCILLAQIDVFFRTGRPPKSYGNVEKGDVADLFELTKVIKIEDFIAKDYIILNPTFGEASMLVGGADADIIIDGVLIDIKTTKFLSLKREYFDQLIGYYILTLIGGVDGIKEIPEIKELGIYFSRYGKLVKFSVKEVINKQELEDFIKWFKEKASSVFGKKE
ncbi:MAG: hypothetical protein ACTSP3_00255 [Candidatus Heimdallarchaeaceae archaeon]